MFKREPVGWVEARDPRENIVVPVRRLGLEPRPTLRDLTNHAAPASRCQSIVARGVMYHLTEKQKCGEGTALDVDLAAYVRHDYEAWWHDSSYRRWTTDRFLQAALAHATEVG